MLIKENISYKAEKFFYNKLKDLHLSALTSDFFYQLPLFGKAILTL